MGEKEKVEMCKNTKNLNSIKMDKVKYKLLERELNGVLDVIKVYNLDYTIFCFNEAGYNFYKKEPEEIKGKKCYEILGRNEKCLECLFDEVVKTKEIRCKETYIPKLNKFIEVCYKPVIDDNGEVLYIVERMHDVTEKKVLHKKLEGNKERYKQVINSIPDAVVIIVDNIIVLANYEACNLLDLSYEELIGSNIYKHFQEKYVKPLHKRFRNIIFNKKVKDISDYEFILPNNMIANLQISYSYLSYEGNPAIIAVIRDITEIKHELNKAAKFQRKTLQSDFKSIEYINIETVYIPANIISGDFYRIYKINEYLIIGMLIDVRGKGVSAALNISAFDILCSQEIAITHEPMEIVKNLNRKLVNYYEENYIAICCFSIDFINDELKAVGAGINQFIFQEKGDSVEEKIAAGAFLGMFENSEFDEVIIPFKPGDKFFFFTDGLDFILDEDKIIQRYMGKVEISKFKEYIDEFLNDTILDVGQLDDDCTMIAIEIN